MPLFGIPVFLLLSLDPELYALDVRQVTPKYESCHNVVLCLEMWAVSNQFDVVGGKHYADIYVHVYTNMLMIEVIFLL